MLYLVRHGETSWNAEGRFQGATDVGLNANGRRQGALIAERLKGLKVDGIYSSDLGRCRQTAEIIAEKHHMKPAYSQALREICYGRWEGLTREEVKTKYPQEYSTYIENPLGTRIKGAETYYEAQDRVVAEVNKLIEQREVEKLILVMHGAIIRLLVAQFLSIKLEYRNRLDIHNASLQIIRYGDKEPSLTLWNDTSHLNYTLEEGVLDYPPL